MKILASFSMLLLLAACTTISPTPDSGPTDGPNQAATPLSGTWTGDWEIDPPYETVIGGFTMELVQTDASFTGTVEPTNTDCSSGTVSGTLDGTDITFGWFLSSERVEFSGVLDGTSMSGTWAAPACSDPNIALTGTWEASKQ
jgi:hypothetical protein